MCHLREVTHGQQNKTYSPRPAPMQKCNRRFNLYVAASNGDRYSVEELKMGGDFQELDCIVLCQAKLSLRVLMEMVTNVSESESL